ncbi:IS110 family transposase [Flexistipes sp.]|uniref:IS110 family transposase n=1 Tax=Flexistipes sp. TaxID=3088135 RepID=UPI002E24A676|nr:IS110 family transposase [Flexistipes sp.]
MFKYFIGVDVSKDKFNFAVINGDLENIDNGCIEMNRTGFEEFKSKLDFYQDIIIAMESTGSYHINLLSFLGANNFKTALVNPALIKKFSEGSSLRKTKTDELDAVTIGKFIFKNIEYLDRFVPYSVDEVTALARLRENIVKEIAKTKTQLKQNLNLVFPEIVKECNIFNDTILNILEVFPTPESIRKAPKSKLKGVFNKASKGKKGRNLSLTYDRFKELALDSIGISSEGYAKIVEHNIKSLKFLQSQLEEISNDFIDKINDSKKDDMEILSSIKGIGNTTAAHFIVEVRDINRFENRNKLSAYAGIDPSFKESGTSVNIKGKVTKKGNKSLRRALYLMATGVMKFNDYFRAYYLKKKSEGMSHRKAMIALCNKLLRTIFALLTRREFFVIKYS